MKWSFQKTATALLIIPLAAASTFSCDNIAINEHTYDLSPLKGPHSVVTSLHEDSTVYNTTYTIDLCFPLKRAGDNIPEKELCPTGTRVCAIQRAQKDGEEMPVVREAVPIAGDLEKYGAVPWEVVTDEYSDAIPQGVEGFALELKGGIFPIDGPHKEQFKKKAIVTFVCDEGLLGSEGEWKTDVEYANSTDMVEERGVSGLEETPGKETQFLNNGAALLFEKYRNEGNDATGVLRLTWKTKYACKNAAHRVGTAGWGFLTWIIILAFMLTSAYLIFGSWLNYTRHGARGWDLLPHSDAIRDVPYLVQDFTRKVLNTVQSSGSRGGYSAV